MHIHVLQENLLRALSRTGRIVPAKPQLPILQNILLLTEGGVVKITASNLETTETTTVGAKITEEGGICVPSRLLCEYVSSLPQDTVQLTVADNSLLVQCAGYKATIPGISPKEYPRVDEHREKHPLVLSKESFIQNLTSVLFSAAADEGRPVLTGVRIIEKPGGVTFAATDGYRLSVKKQETDTVQGLDLLVPSRAVSEVVKIAAEEREAKDILVSRQQDNQLLFVIGDTSVRTRLIDGEYPNFERIIPEKYNTRVIFDREILQKAVKSASIFARDSANIVRLTIAQQTVSVSANTPQYGEDHIDIDAQVEGDGGEMAFNSKFLLDFLTSVKNETLIFEMTGSLNPGVFRIENDDTYLHIIMPVRTT